MNDALGREKRGSCWPGVATGVALLALAALLWLSVGDSRAAAAMPVVLQRADTPGIAQVITVGVAADLSGGVQFIGWPEANAVQMAVDEVNAAGGLEIGGTFYQVALVLADDQCDPGQAAGAAQALLDAGAVGVIGHTCSGATIAAEPTYAGAGIAMISPSATNPAVTLQGNNVAFRTCQHSGSSPAQLARYARRGLGLEKSSFVAWKDAPLGISLYYSSTFTALAGTITGFHQVNDTAEFTATLTAIKHDEQPDIIFYADSDPGRAGLFSRVAYRVGMDDVIVAWHSGDVFQDIVDQYQAAAGAEAANDDLIGMEYRRPADMPGWPSFLADYQAAGFSHYGQDPGIFGPYAYDAARILLAAINRADSTDPAAIRDQVHATKDHVGVVGTYLGFDPQGDVMPQWGWLEHNDEGKWYDVETYAWADDFASPELGPFWSWVREDATHWSLTDRPGWLRITTQPGGLWGEANDEKNLLLMPAPPGDFYLTVRLEFAPTADVHQAGLIVYHDDDNYVRLSRVSVGGEPYVEMVCEIDGATDVTGTLEAATHLDLQLIKRGSEYEGYYSLDGVVWTPVGEYTADLGSVMAGLGASHDQPGPPDIPADFTSFRLIGGLPRRDYGWSDHFDKGLNEVWGWVREDATHWSLDDRPGFMQITTQHGTLLGPDNDARNLLLRPAPAAGWRIGTRVLFTPTEDFQIAGLLVYEDDDNFMLYGRAYCDVVGVCAGNGIYFDHEEDGGYVGGNDPVAFALPYLAYLQLERSGSQYWGFYGEDGIYWTLTGYTLAGPDFHPTRVGLAANNAAMDAAEIDAAFDGFWLAADYLRAFLPVTLRTYHP